MRFIITAILLVFCSVSLQAEEPAINSIGESKISEEHQACSKDSDCTLFSLECSCDCGQPVNIKFLGEYLTLKVDKCKTYTGRLCKMKCPGSEAVVCKHHKCAVAEDWH